MGWPRGAGTGGCRLRDVRCRRLKHRWFFFFGRCSARLCVPSNNPIDRPPLNQPIPPIQQAVPCARSDAQRLAGATIDRPINKLSSAPAVASRPAAATTAARSHYHAPAPPGQPGAAPLLRGAARGLRGPAARGCGDGGASHCTNTRFQFQLLNPSIHPCPPHTIRLTCRAPSCWSSAGSAPSWAASAGPT